MKEEERHQHHIFLQQIKINTIKMWTKHFFFPEAASNSFFLSLNHRNDTSLNFTTYKREKIKQLNELINRGKKVGRRKIFGEWKPVETRRKSGCCSSGRVCARRRPSDLGASSARTWWSRSCTPCSRRTVGRICPRSRPTRCAAGSWWRRSSAPTPTRP